MFLRFRRKSSLDALRDLTDGELLSQFRRTQDTEIIGLLFQRYTHLVYGVCLNYLDDPDDAKDAVMEIFEGLMESLLRYEVSNFKSWLHSVTRNHCLMKLRKDRMVIMDIEKIHQKIDGEFVEIEEDLHQEDVVSKFNHEDLGTVLQSLKGPQRQCLELVYLEDKSYQEVCEITGFTLNEVKSHVQNGKRNLKIRLEAKNGR